MKYTPMLTDEAACLGSPGRKNSWPFVRFQRRGKFIIAAQPNSLPTVVSNLNQQSLRPFPNLNQHCEPRFKPGVGPPQFTRENAMPTKSGGSKRGFAAMDPAKQREIASKGGKASHGGGRKASSSR